MTCLPSSHPLFRRLYFLQLSPSFKVEDTGKVFSVLSEERRSLICEILPPQPSAAQAGKTLSSTAVGKSYVTPIPASDDALVNVRGDSGDSSSETAVPSGIMRRIPFWSSDISFGWDKGSSRFWFT